MLGLNSVIVAVLILSSICRAKAGFRNTFTDLDNPPRSYGPHVFWHWINGDIEQSAIDRDVDNLYESGYGGVLLYDVNTGIPPGPVRYDSNEWLDLLVHAVDRLSQKGMIVAMHNAPGYSGVGSTKLPVNMTMKELVWTEKRVTTPSPVISTISTTSHFEKPFSKLGVYQDFFVLAYPALTSEGVVFRDAVRSVAVDGVVQNTSITTTIDKVNPLRLASSNAELIISMKALFVAQAIAIYRMPEAPLNTFDGSRDYPPTNITA